MRRLLKLLALTAAIAIVPLRCVQKFSAVLDADIWLRLRTGEWIAQNHAFPHNGLFTQHTELPWIAYSWGFDLLSWFVFHSFGPNGLANITVLLIALQALLATVLFVCLERTSKYFFASAALTATALWAANSLSLRSLLFSLIFYTIELFLLLASERDGQAKRLWWLVPVFVVWTNIHIQFVYGLFVLFLFALAMSVSDFAASRSARFQPSRIQARTSWLVLISCAAATLVNPYFAAVYRTIFSYAGNTTQYEQIIEYSAINFRQPQHYDQLLLVLAAFFVIGWEHRLEPFRLALLTSTTLVAFRSQRDGWFVCIAAALLLAESFRPAQSPGSAIADERRAFVIPAVAFCLAILISFGAANRRGLDPQSLIQQIDREYPVRAASFIADSHLPGPLYNSYNWGEYLVFNLLDYPVSIDGRTDLFGPAMDTRAMATVNAYDLEHDSDFQRARVILIEKFLPLANYLANDPRYKLVYSDHIAVVFARVQ